MLELTKAANHPNLTHSRRDLVCGNVYIWTIEKSSRFSCEQIVLERHPMGGGRGRKTDVH